MGSIKLDWSDETHKPAIVQSFEQIGLSYEKVSDASEAKIYIVYFGYMPRIIDAKDIGWHQLDKALASGVFDRGRDRLLIDCSWEGWSFRPADYEYLHAQLRYRGVALDRVALLTMCLNLPRIYADWAEGRQEPSRMTVLSFWGTNAPTRAHFAGVLGDQETFRRNSAEWFEARVRGVSLENRFLCMNNMPKPERTATAMTLHEKAASCALISHGPLGGVDLQDWARQVRSWLIEPDRVEERLADFASKTPMVLDVATGNAEARDATTYAFDPSLYRRSAMSVVSESEASPAGLLRATEKTMKPLAMLHPFVLCGNKGVLGALRGMGYKTFDGFIDESYDEIDDPCLRIQAVQAEVVRLSRLSDEAFAQALAKVAPAVLHNALHFYYMHEPTQWAWLNSLQMQLAEFQGERSVTAGLHG